MTKRDVAGHTGHSELDVRDGEFLGYFFIAPREVSEHLCVTPGFHCYVQYSTARKKLLREATVMKALKIPPRSVLVGHGSVLLTGSKCRAKHFSRYHNRLKPENRDPQNAVAFAFGGSIGWGAEKHSLSIQKAPDQQVRYLGEQPRMIRGCRRSSESESSDLELSTFLLKAGNTLEDE